jgi:peptide/nickel transport system ATP-binding protein
VTVDLLEVEDLSTTFAGDRGAVRAVDRVSLRVNRGKTLAIVGESGSGKTALVSSIMGIHAPASNVRVTGRVLLDGTDLVTLQERELRRLWGRKVSIVQQNPLSSLNPVMRVGRQLTESIRHCLGMSDAEAKAEALDLLRQVGIPGPERRMRAYPHQMSGGMRQRVAIAIALAGRPDLLIADEPTTALDVTVQAQILRLLKDIQRDRDMAMIFISHDLAVVSGIADDIQVMYSGRVVESGSARSVLSRPHMPYTHGLLRSRPRLDMPSHTRLQAIPGRPPAAGQAGDSCPFAPRCDRSTDKCTSHEPPLSSLESAHHFACWHPVTDDGR